MSLPPEWIAPLAESCLQAFLHESGTGAGQQDVRWDDDGANIHFFKYKAAVPAQALISNLTENESHLKVTLADRRNHIEAVLTGEALKRYGSESKGQARTRRRGKAKDWVLLKHEIRGCPMTLRDFEVVFGYSRSKPEVHLLVKNFLIDLSCEKKIVPIPKKVTNDSGLSILLDLTFAAAKGLRKGRGTTGLKDGGGPSALTGSQDSLYFRENAPKQIYPDPAMSQGAFISQTLAVPRRTPLGIDPTPGRGALKSRPELLAHLARSSNGPYSEPLMDINHGQLQEIGLRRFAQPGAENKNKQSCSSVQEFSNVDSLLGSANDQHHETTSTAGAIRSNIAVIDPSAKGYSSNAGAETLATGVEARDTAKAHSPVQEGDVSVNNGLETKSYEVKDAELQPVVEPLERTEVPDSHSRLSPGYVDPWNGMTRIQSRDTRIPDDQRYLLEEKRLWVPPSPGMELPRGHVPLTLLDKWNKAVSRRTPLAQTKEENHMTTKSPSPEAPPLHSSGSQADSEEGCQLPWSPSPSRRELLPPDSSPIRPKTPRLAKSPTNPCNVDGDDQPQDIDDRMIQDVEEDYRVRNGGIMEDGAIVCFTRRRSRTEELLADNDTARPDDEAHTSLPGHESDGESDLLMDTSIPCPLDDDAATRRGPDQIQVIETPVSNSLRQYSQVAIASGPTFAKNGWKELCREQSSQAEKCSSQSQIIDTYRENQREEESYQPQGMAGASLDEASSVVNVAGTQEGSSGKQSVSQTVLRFQPGVVLDSSENRHHDEGTSISLPASRAAEQLPSSWCKVLSAELGDSSNSSIHSPPKEIPSVSGANMPQVRISKRPAEEAQSDYPTPKRHKRSVHGDKQASVEVLQGSQDSGAAACRQGYTADRSGPTSTARALEKFRNDYPSYSGDFPHFTELCHKLQCLRTDGKLTRSFLWDDFIIMHLEKYPSYLEQCHAADTKSLAYEEYFTSTFSRALHKRRSLTASVIELSAAQYSSAGQSKHSTGMNHARCERVISVAHNPVKDRPDLYNVDLQKASESEHADKCAGRLIATAISPMCCYPSFSAKGYKPDKARQVSSSAEEGSSLSSPAATGSEVKKEEYESSTDGSESEAESEGDNDIKTENVPSAVSIGPTRENSIPQRPCRSPECRPKGLNKLHEDVNENWFVSLRHVRPTGPAWSDTRNTPFKIWARAYLNVKSERALRGGRYLVIDEHGVVQRESLAYSSRK